MLGLVQAIGVEYVWNHLVLVNPAPHWLVTHGITGNLLRWLLYTQDALINALLCLPLVLVLRRLRPFHPWAYLAIALLVVEAWTYRFILTHSLPQGVGYDLFVPGALVTIAAFAMAGIAQAALARIRPALP